MADKFLAGRGVPLAGPAKASNARHLRAAMRILHEFEFSGCFHRRRGFSDHRCSQRAMNDALETYIRYCSKHQMLSSSTMHGRRRTLAWFLRLLEARGHIAPATMTSTDIRIYARSRAHLGQATICGEMSSLRSFIRVGVALGYIPQDLSGDVPRIPTRRYSRIPSVWKPSDVEAMLRGVDRGSPDSAFFPAPHGGAYSTRRVYDIFRRLLCAIGISHGGPGIGPRLHDLRATFAVHRVEAWYREGAELGAKLPSLSAYMGHLSLLGTQKYLRLTLAIFPDLARHFEQAYGYLLPRPPTP
jgi:site-specific recombinase XerC